LTDGFFSHAQAAGEERLRDVVAVERRDVLFARFRHRLLGLHDFDVAGDAGGEAVAGLRELLRRQLTRAGRDLQLFTARLQVEEGAADVVVDAGPQIFGFGTAIAKISVRLLEPSLRPAALEDRHRHGAGNRECRSGVSWRQAETDGAVVGGDMDGGQRLTEDRLAIELRCPDALEGGLIVRPGLVGPFQRIVESHFGNRNVGQLVDQRERLADRQAHQPRQLQSRFLEVVARRGGSLALGSKLHLGAKHLDAGDDAARPHARRLVEDRFRGFGLGPGRFGACRGCQRLQVDVGGCEDHQITGAPH
jgi:hypothetical protein